MLLTAAQISSMEKEHRAAIKKSRSYFDQRLEFSRVLDRQKALIMQLESEVKTMFARNPSIFYLSLSLVVSFSFFLSLSFYIFLSSFFFFILSSPLSSAFSLFFYLPFLSASSFFRSPADSKQSYLTSIIKVRQKKSDYTTSLRNLERISDSIHEQRSLGGTSNRSAPVNCFISHSRFLLRSSRQSPY